MDPPVQNDFHQPESLQAEKTTFHKAEGESNAAASKESERRRDDHELF